MKRRPAPWTLSAVVAVILLATLVPLGGGSGVAEPLSGCLLCGERGFADALVNALLFLPLGAELARRGGGVALAAAAGFSLSLGIEALQQVVPGRDPSPGDLLFNGFGALAGALLWREARGRVVSGRGRLRWPGPAVAAGVAAVLVGGAVLMKPARLGPGRYLVEWAPPQAGQPPLPGRVVRAEIASRPLPPGVESRPARLSEPLDRGAPLRVVLVLDSAVPGRAPILRVRDAAGADVLVIAAAGDALVVSRRTRAAALRLDQPDVRLDGALDPARLGKRTRIAVWRARRTECVQVDRRVDCSMGVTLGDGWSVLLYPGALPSATRRLVGMAWLAALMLPVGFVARRAAGLVAALFGFSALLLWLPRLVAIAPTPPGQVAAAAIGLLAGWGARRLSRPFPPRNPAPPPTEPATPGGRG